MKWLEFALMAGKLKRLRRSGWKRYKIREPESVAEHSFRTALLALVMAKELGVDRDRAVRMALVHDLGEAVIGDVITNRWGKALPNLESKLAEEHAAVRAVTGLVRDDESRALFEEFAAGETETARAVAQLDKLEMAIQAYEYELRDGLDLQEFYVSARAGITDKRLLAVLDDIDKKGKI